MRLLNLAFVYVMPFLGLRIEILKFRLSDVSFDVSSEVWVQALVLGFGRGS